MISKCTERSLYVKVHIKEALDRPQSKSRDDWLNPCCSIYSTHPPSKNYENNVYIWEIYRGKNTNADALGPVFIDKASEYGDGIS